MSPPAVHVLVPAGIHDPSRPSGGNTYDRRLCQALELAGWSVHVRELPGGWPDPGETGRAALDCALGALPSGSLVLVDGLVASTQPQVIVPACRRLTVVLLMHMPVGAQPGREDARPPENAVLRAVSLVVTTSAWSRAWLVSAYAMDPERVRVAHPGTDVAPRASGTWSGSALLCVGAVTPGKGHDLLLSALTRVRELPWQCSCVGSLTVCPDYVAAIRQGARRAGLDERFRLEGPRTGGALDAAYAEADVLVLASRSETYGMVVTEALARGLPVVAADVGGVPEALGAAADGTRPGFLTPPGDVPALASALRLWLTDADTRARLRAAAAGRRAGLGSWTETAERVGKVLLEVAA